MISPNDENEEFDEIIGQEVQDEPKSKEFVLLRDYKLSLPYRPTKPGNVHVSFVASKDVPWNATFIGRRKEAPLVDEYYTMEYVAYIQGYYK